MIEVLHGGMQTTVQDRGRFGWRHVGVGCAGALDAHSMQLANLLVGNAPCAPLLELTLVGPRLRLTRGARIAITGARIDAYGDGTALPGMRPIDVPASMQLQFGRCRQGARAYLAIDGGIDVAPILGSASTDLRGGFGGLEGRALRQGDRLVLGAPRINPSDALRIAPWWIDAQPDVDLERAAELHLLPASDACVPASALFDSGWKVSSQSDRQGLRLQGPKLQLRNTRERISAPVAPGSVQLPPDGQPIVLLADAQTTGGYPCIGHVASADLARLGQCRAGDEVYFAPIDVVAAQARRRMQQARLHRIAFAIAQRRDG